MNCDEARLAFASHLDGEELSAAEAAALDGHLADCALCRTQAQELAETHRDLLVLRATEASFPERAPDAIRKKVEPSAIPPSEPAHRHSFWIEAAAAVVLAAILAFLLWPKGRPTEDGSDPQRISQAETPPPLRVGRVTAAQGRVEGGTSGTTNPLALVPGTELLAGQEIRVAQGSFAELDLQDGVRVRLESASVLRFGESGGSNGLMLLTGKGRFEVTARDELWRLQTPGATVESKGGLFVVTVQE